MKIVLRSKLLILDLMLALFVASAFLGLWPAYDRDLAWFTLLALLLGLALYVVVSWLAISPERWRPLAAGLLVLPAVVLAFYFVSQYPHFDYASQSGIVGKLGSIIGRLAPDLAFWVPTDNGVATFLEGSILVTIGFVLVERDNKRRLLWLLAVGFMGLALLMTKSRGAWLGVLVAVAVWATLYWRPARVVVTVGFAVALLLALYAWVQGDIAVLGEIPLANRVLVPLFVRPDRLDVYRESSYLIQDFPFSGIGLGPQFGWIHARYALLIQHLFLPYSHNLYLEVWLQQGLLGIVAWLALIAALVGAVWQAGRHDRKHLLFQGVWLGLAATLVHGLSDARQYVELWTGFPFFALLGLSAAVLRRDTSPIGWHSWLLPAGVASLFLLLVIPTLWPLPATWQANRGAVLQARADLAPSLDEEQQAELRQQALAHYQQAAEGNPGDRTAQARLGLMLMEANDFELAVAHWDAALQADPGNTTTQKGLGLAYVWVGELERAEPLLRGVKDIVQELNNWAWWRNSQGQLPQAIYAYRMSLMLNPDQPAVRDRLEQLEPSSP